MEFQSLYLHRNESCSSVKFTCPDKRESLSRVRRDVDGGQLYYEMTNMHIKLDGIDGVAAAPAVL